VHIIILNEEVSSNTSIAQLGIESIFKIRIGKNNLQTHFKEICGEDPSLRLTFLHSINLSKILNETLEELKELLKKHKIQEKVIFWPAHYMPLNKNDFRDLLKKLRLLDETVFIDLDSFQIPFIIVDDLYQNLDPDQTIQQFTANQVLNYRLETVNINSPVGIFEFSRTQTSSRSFNTLIYNYPYLCKQSSKISKMQSEYNFFINAPEHIRAYLPQVGNFRKNIDLARYEIEFLPMFDLSRFLIHHQMSDKKFESFLEKIEIYLKNTPHEIVANTTAQTHFKKMTVEKVDQRMSEFKKTSLYPKVSEACHVFTGYSLEGFIDQFKALVEKHVPNIKSLKLGYYHGDLCASNVLWDNDSERIKLIDPRGAEKGQEIFEEYDLAKLSHSLCRGYDFIMNRETQLEIQKDLSFKINYNQHDAYLKQIQKLFYSWCKKNNFNIKLILLTEASLFLSMAPLHLDNPDLILQQILSGLAALEALEKTL